MWRSRIRASARAPTTGEPLAGERDLAGVGTIEPAEQVQQRRLAAARAAEHGHDLAGGHVQRRRRRAHAAGRARSPTVLVRPSARSTGTPVNVAPPATEAGSKHSHGARRPASATKRGRPAVDGDGVRLAAGRIERDRRAGRPAWCRTRRAGWWRSRSPTGDRARGRSRCRRGAGQRRAARQRRRGRVEVDEQRVAAGVDDVQPAAGPGDDMGRTGPGAGAAEHASVRASISVITSAPTSTTATSFPTAAIPPGWVKPPIRRDLAAAGDHRYRAAELVGDEHAAVGGGGVVGQRADGDRRGRRPRRRSSGSSSRRSSGASGTSSGTGRGAELRGGVRGRRSRTRRRTRPLRRREHDDPRGIADGDGDQAGGRVGDDALGRGADARRSARPERRVGSGRDRRLGAGAMARLGCGAAAGDGRPAAASDQGGAAAPRSPDGSEQDLDRKRLGRQRQPAPAAAARIGTRPRRRTPAARTAARSARSRPW